MLLRQQAKGIAGILHRRNQTAVTILRAKQLLSAFCYYPLLMAWGGGVFTLHLYRIIHSVIPNWGPWLLCPVVLLVLLHDWYLCGCRWYRHDDCTELWKITIRLTLGFRLKSVGFFYVVPSEQIRPSVNT